MSHGGKDSAQDESMDAIIDLMELELGASSKKQDASARSKFDAFLIRISHARSFRTMRKEDVTKVLLGQFCSFLLQDDAIRWQTSMNYLSSIKRQLEESTNTELFMKDSDWYRRCRRNLHEKYVLEAIKTGKRLKDQAAVMTLQDLELMSTMLFAQNDPRSLMDRTLLNNQWLSIGRSSDIGSLLYTDLHWLDTFLVIDLTRLKVRQQHTISIFCSPGNWAIDPYHALASQLLGDPYNASRRVFSHVLEGKDETRVAAHINRVLKSMNQSDTSAALTRGLQSHSARRGGAAHASSHADVNLSDLAHRGLWSMDGFATLLEYISPTSASDQTVAKVLGGWKEPNKAGIPPSLASFVSETHDMAMRVEDFARRMREMFFFKIEKRGFADCLTATMLMYYDETSLAFPQHVVHDQIGLAAASMSLRAASHSELKEWGRVIRKQFVLDNLLALPVEYVKRNMSEKEISEQYVGLHTFAGALERGVLGYREVSAELQDVKALLHRVLDGQHELRALLSASGKSGAAANHPSAGDPLPAHVTVGVGEQRRLQLGLSTAATNPTNPLLQLAKPWPKDLVSLKVLHLQDLIVRYVRDRLRCARYSPRNRVQKEVRCAMQLVAVFADIGSVPDVAQFDSEASALAYQQQLSEYARRIQSSVLEFIESRRSSAEGAKRQRQMTGSVSGLVRAWGDLDMLVREQAVTQEKLKFSARLD